MVLLLPYGGAVTAVGEGETAVPHRGSVLRLLVQSIWADEADDTAYVA